jgi:hypothetical protein
LSPTCEPDPGNAGGGIAILRLGSHPNQGGFFYFTAEGAESAEFFFLRVLSVLRGEEGFYGAVDFCQWGVG